MGLIEMPCERKISEPGEVWSNGPVINDIYRVTRDINSSTYMNVSQQLSQAG